MFKVSPLTTLLLYEIRKQPQAAAFSLGALLLQIVGTLLLIPLAEQVLHVLQGGSLSAIARCLMWIVLGYTLKHLGEYTQQYSAGVFSLWWMKGQQATLYHQVLQAEMQALRDFQPEDLQSLMHEDLRHLQGALFLMLYRGLPAVVLCGVLLLTLIYLSWAFTLLMLVFVGGARFLLRGIQQKLPVSSQVLQRTMSAIYQELGDGFYGRQFIRQSRWLTYQQQRFERLQEAWFPQAKRVLALQALERPLMGILQIMVLACILFVCVLGVRQGFWELDRLVAFATALALAIDPGLWWAETRAMVQRAQGSWSRLQAFTERFCPYTDGVQFHAQTGLRLLDIQVKKGETDCFTALSWQVPQGVKWGVTGDSGQGKSTLLAVLAGLEPLQRGTVFWPEAWKKESPAVVLVAQEAYFFHRSVRENLQGPQPLSDAELWAALETCQLKARIQALPQGLDTLMGEGGVYFSGGEKQRLALARALLMSPACLLLDEATTELDETNESLILQALCARKDLTCLVVSHQPRTLRHVQETWHLEEGCLHQGVRSV